MFQDFERYHGVERVVFERQRLAWLKLDVVGVLGGAFYHIASNNLHLSGIEQLCQQSYYVAADIEDSDGRLNASTKLVDELRCLDVSIPKIKGGFAGLAIRQQ